MIKELTNKIINEEYHISKNEATELLKTDVKDLSYCAEQIRKKFCDSKFDMCSIINAKSGKCSENCKFCAQSAHYKTNIKEYSLLDTNSIFNVAKHNWNKKVKRFSIVT